MPISLSDSLEQGLSGPYPIKKPPRFCQNPSPLCELHFTFLQGFVAVIERHYSLLQALTLVRKLVNFMSRGCSENVCKLMLWADRNSFLVYL